MPRPIYILLLLMFAVSCRKPAQHYIEQRFTQRYQITNYTQNDMNSKMTETFGDLGKIDLEYALSNEDCAVLDLIAVGYVDGDPATQKNLLDKMERYLIHIQSDLFKSQYPQSKVYIDVIFADERPHDLILQLLFKCQSWCEENGATLRIRIRDKYVQIVSAGTHL